MGLLNRISAFFYRLTSAWTLLAVTAVYAVFLTTVMPQQSATSRAYAGEWGAPDRQFFYTPDVLHQQLDRWSEAGRRDYIEFRLGLDIGWALTYTGFLVLAIGCAVRAGGPASARRRLLNLTPLPALFCDLAENALGIFLVAALPARHEALAWVAAFTTSAKWLTLAAAHLVLLYLLAVALWGWFRNRVQ
ncbi:MAG: hypothetical protein L6Q83_07615 [Gammaproteobacteria bacterium]|nr:hypothetical protein [Gammaproteobacteria bacterium]